MTTLARRSVRALRTWLKRSRPPDSPPAPEPDERALWERIDPMQLAGDLGAIVADPEGAVRLWIVRKPAPAAYLYRVDPQPTTTLRRRADELLAGNFRPHATIPVRRETLPPQWDRQPESTRTEEMYRHSLTWLESLISVAHVDGDDDIWQVVKDVILSWIRTNSTPPGGSPGAWHDHAVAFRVRILCWFFELYRRQRPAIDESFVRLLVASIYQHGMYLADDTTHGPRSNHALEAAGSLLAVSINFPELRTAREWAGLAGARVESYVGQAFASDGFSKEQSPRYHFFILRRLAALLSYLGAVEHPLPAGVRHSLERAAEVWPWLIRDDGTLPRIGDSNERPIPHWRRSLTEIGGEPPTAAPSSLPNPRDDTAALLASAGGIYAVMRGHHPEDPEVVDTHVVFKTDYFRFPHFHYDGLSFVLYALGREWLIDPGPHSYEYERWERRYLCSSSAHNVVEVGGPFDVNPVEVVDIARTMEADRVSARHDLGHAVHTRTLEHRPHRQLHIRDEIDVTDGGQHHIRQLFHANPECEIEVDDRELRLVAPTGDRCTITQASPGAWRIVHGQREPEPLGWYSPRPMVIAPIDTCIYELEAGGHVEFDTHIEVVPADPTSPSDDHPTTSGAQCQGG